MEDSLQCIRAIPLELDTCSINANMVKFKNQNPQFQRNNNYTTIIINILTTQGKNSSHATNVPSSMSSYSFIHMWSMVTVLSFEPQTTMTCNE
jgi:hypothetical protein